MIKDNVTIDLNYLNDESHKKKMLYILDTIFMSLLYFFIGLGTSTFINKRICRKLDTSKNRVYLFFETTAETFLVILVLFFIIFSVERLPIIVPNPDREHYKFRQRTADIILAITTFFGHERLENKYKYLLGNY